MAVIFTAAGSLIVPGVGSVNDPGPAPKRRTGNL